MLKRVFWSTLCLLILSSVIIFLSAGISNAVVAFKVTNLKKNEVLNIGEKRTLTFSGTKKATWKISNKKVATISKKGVLIVHSGGTAVVTARSSSGAKKSIRIYSKTLTNNGSIALGKKVKASKLTNPNTIFSNKDLKLTTSNKKVASIYKKKYIKANKKGSAKITAYSRKKNTTYIINLKVVIPATSLTLESSSLSIVHGNKHKLAPKVLPNNTTDTIKYKSNNTKIVKVDSKGNIKPVKAGTTKILVQAGTLKKYIKVTITPAAKLKVKTHAGYINGKKLDNNNVVWYGVPYALPPVGELRWRAPQDLTPWTGTLTTTTRKRAPALSNGEIVGSEDCLYLNVTRANSTTKNLPVLVFIHGGGNTSGTSMGLTPKTFVENNNCIVVSVEFRLGAFGWFNAEALKNGNPLDDSGNYATLDIIKALEWTKTNIANFGGDKNNITVMGNSAGSRNICSVMVSPLGKNLFNKIILLAGGPSSIGYDESLEITRNKIADLLVRRGNFPNKEKALDYLDTAAPTAIKSLLYSLSTMEVATIFSGSSINMNNWPQHIVDGNVIPETFTEAVKKGNYTKVPMIIGASANEYSQFLLSNYAFSVAWKYDGFRSTPDLGELALNCLNYGNNLYSSFNLDGTARLLTSNGNSDIYAYRMNWGRNSEITNSVPFSTYMGATHGNILSFVNASWGSTYDYIAPDLYSNANLNGRVALSKRINQHFENFLHTGNPNGNGYSNWSKWSTTEGENKILIMDANNTVDISSMTSKYILAEDVFEALEEDTELSEETKKTYLYNYMFVKNNLFISNPPEGEETDPNEDSSIED